jgi:hypothetical protein
MQAWNIDATVSAVFEGDERVPEPKRVSDLRAKQAACWCVSAKDEVAN